MGKLHLAVVEITNNCNLRCKHCYGSFGIGKKRNVTKKEFLHICKELKNGGVEMLTISGGEPLVFGSKINYFLSIAKKFFNTVTLTTNGILVNKSNVLLLKQCDHVQLSLDGSPKKHDCIRGKGTYSNVISSLDLLIKNKIRCSLMMTVSDYNINSVRFIYSIAKKKSVPLGFERMTNIGSGKLFNSLSKNNLKKLIDFSLKNKISSSDPIYLIADNKKRDYLLKNKILSGCMAGIMAISIDSNLNIFPCSRLRVSLGNLKHESLNSILAKSPIIKQLKNRKLKGRCQKCKWRFLCGGCRAQAYSQSNDIFAADPGCYI